MNERKIIGNCRRVALATLVGTMAGCGEYVGPELSPNGLEETAYAGDIAGDQGSDQGALAGAAAAVGDACDPTTLCPEGGSGIAVCRADWPDGYCLVEDCGAHLHNCPGDPGIAGTSGESKCVLAPTETCLAMCTTSDDCRPGYACEDRDDAAGHGAVAVCVPAPAAAGGDSGGSGMGGGMMMNCPMGGQGSGSGGGMGGQGSGGMGGQGSGGMGGQGSGGMGGQDGGGMGGQDGGGAGNTGGGTTSNGGPAVGEACDDTTACPAGGSGTAVCRTRWPGGYCLVETCADHGHDCPGDPGLGGTTGESKCVLAPTATCLRLCATDADCRSGYVCASRDDAAGHGPADVCVPAAP